MQSLNDFIKKRNDYVNLAFFGGGATLNQRIELFSMYDLKMPDVVCDNNAENHNLMTENNIPMMSFEDAIYKYDNLHVVITSDKYMNEILQQVLTKIPIERVFYFTPNEILEYNEQYVRSNTVTNIEELIKNRNNYEGLLFYIKDRYINISVKLFYRCSIEMPDAVCDDDEDKYDLPVEGVIPRMSFDSALEQFENSYIVVIVDDNFVNNIALLMGKVPRERIICLEIKAMSQYIKNRDYSKYDFHMPKHIKKIKDKLKYYQDLYAKRENIRVRTDDFFIKSKDKYVYLVDYMDRDKIEFDVLLNVNSKIKVVYHKLSNGYLSAEYPICIECEKNMLKMLLRTR